MYPVQFCLNDGNFAVRLAEIQDWLNKHRIDPGVLQYQLGADDVRVRIEFTKPSHVGAFRAAFGEAYLAMAG